MAILGKVDKLHETVAWRGDIPIHSRYSAGIATLVFFVIGMMILCGWSYGSQAIPVVLIGTVIEWPGQIMVLICLRWINTKPRTGVAQTR